MWTFSTHCLGEGKSMGLVTFSKRALRMPAVLRFLSSSPASLSSAAIHRTCWSVGFGGQLSAMRFCQQ